MASSSPVAIVCVGMAGSGKTTFMQRLNSHLHTKRSPPYILNLDPAVRTVPFTPNIDIRDSINYKEVMKQYSLGPNGGILTSLNLFATKVDQILGLLERRTGIQPQQSQPSSNASATSTSTAAQQPSPLSKPIKHILVDTPGQIEVFVWSASGSILLDSLASSFPTVIAYVIDTPRTSSTSTFMSNMLYACSILYKTKLPMILVFNKTDVQDAEFAKEWMTDFEAFQTALQREQEEGGFGGVDGGGGSGYMGSLLNSMSLTLEAFYSHLSVVAVSSMTGAGVEEFFEAVEVKREEFERDYRPVLERKRREREAGRGKDEGRREEELGRLMRGMNVKVGRASGSKKRGGKEEAETVSDVEDEGDEDVETDEDDIEGRGGEDDEGLSQRYKEALAGSGAKDGSSIEDHSFARYLRASNING